MGEDEVARSVRESYLYQARVSLERSLAHIQKAYGAEPDDEKVIRHPLDAEDSIPFDSSVASVGGRDEVSVLGGHPPQFSPSSHREKLASLFFKWCDDAAYMKRGLKSHKLPSMFRFALQRPLMPESTLQKTLEEFGINPTLGFLSGMRVEHTMPKGRIRRTLYGLDPDLSRHVSSKYRKVFPIGLSLLDGGRQQPKQEVITMQDTRAGTQMHGPWTHCKPGLGPHIIKLDERQKHACLWSLYDLIQHGLVDLEEAPDRYRHILDKPDLSNIDLSMRLGDFGLPGHQIRNLDVDESETPDHSSEEKNIIAEITNLVELYISGELQVDEVIALIKETLIGLPINISFLNNLIRDKSRGATSIAESIWEEVAGQHPATDLEASVVKDDDVPVRLVSEEFTEICDDVLGADLKAEDALAMLQAAVGADELTSFQRSHILSKLDSPQSATYNRLLASNADQTEDSANSRTAMRMPIRTFKADVRLSLDKSRHRSQALDPGTFSDVGFLEELSHTDKLPHIIPPRQNPFMPPGTDDHTEGGPVLSSLREATEAFTEDKSLNATQVSVLCERSDLLSTTNKVGHVSRHPLDSWSAPAVVMRPRTCSTSLAQLTKKPTEMYQSLIERPGTPSPKSVQLVAASWQPYLQRTCPWIRYVPNDEMYDSGYMSTSPENGMTSDMFGLSLPTNKAREVAAKLGLPSDYIQEQVRSRTPRRVKTKKFLKASINVTFPSRKRKASMDVNSPGIKIPKRNAIPDLFAQDDEDHEKFIHDYFTWEVLQELKRYCLSCNRLRCTCRKRKRPSTSQGSKSRKRSSLLAFTSNVHPSMSKWPLSDSTSPSDSSPSSCSIAVVGNGKSETPGASVSRNPVKLLLNLPKPLGQPRPSSPSSLSDSPSPPSLPSRSTPSSSPSPPRVTSQPRPPKALLSNLIARMAEKDIMDTLGRLGKAKTAEGEQIRQLVDHALGLIRRNIRPDRPEALNLEKHIEAQAKNSLRHLIEAQLQWKRSSGESSQERSNGFGSGLNVKQKTTTPSRNPSMLDPPNVKSMFLNSNDTLLHPRSSSASAKSENQRENCYGSKVQWSTVLEADGAHNETIANERPGKTVDSKPAGKLGHSASLYSTGKISTGQFQAHKAPTSRDQTRMAREMTQKPRSTCSSTPSLEEATDPAAIRARTRNTPTRYIERRRSGGDYHPWPERGISRTAAIENVHKNALAQRKSFFLYIAEQRLVRPRADLSVHDRFYQGSNKPSSGSGSTSSLNKLFDKYRGIPANVPITKYLMLTRDITQIMQQTIQTRLELKVQCDTWVIWALAWMRLSSLLFSQNYPHPQWANSPARVSSAVGKHTSRPYS